MSTLTTRATRPAPKPAGETEELKVKLKRAQRNYETTIDAVKVARQERDRLLKLLLRDVDDVGDLVDFSEIAI